MSMQRQYHGGPSIEMQGICIQQRQKQGGPGMSMQGEYQGGPGIEMQGIGIHFFYKISIFQRLLGVRGVGASRGSGDSWKQRPAGGSGTGASAGVEGSRSWEETD